MSEDDPLNEKQSASSKFIDLEEAAFMKIVQFVKKILICMWFSVVGTVFAEVVPSTLSLKIMLIEIMEFIFVIDIRIKG